MVKNRYLVPVNGPIVEHKFNINPQLTCPLANHAVQKQLNILAKKKNITDENGNLFYFKTLFSIRTSCTLITLCKRKEDICSCIEHNILLLV